MDDDLQELANAAKRQRVGVYRAQPIPVPVYEKTNPFVAGFFGALGVWTALALILVTTIAVVFISIVVALVIFAGSSSKATPATPLPIIYQTPEDAMQLWARSDGGDNLHVWGNNRSDRMIYGLSMDVMVGNQAVITLHWNELPAKSTVDSIVTVSGLSAKLPDGESAQLRYTAGTFAH